MMNQVRNSGETRPRGCRGVQPDTWAPNEAPASRWVLFFVLAAALGFAAQVPLAVVKFFWRTTGDWYWLSETVCLLGGFACSLAVTARLSRRVLATSLRELVIGARGSVDRRQCVRLVFAWLVGFLFTIALDGVLGTRDSVELNPVGPVPVIVNFVICTALVWMQTTWEEIVYRCTFIRATCGNAVHPTLKCLAWGLVGVCLFVLGHILNPEVTSQADPAALALMLLSYAIPGIGMYLADVVYGSCLPGCVIHWVNNFVLFTVWTVAGTAGESAGLFFVRSDSSGGNFLLGDLVLYAPILALLAYDWVKLRRSVGEGREA